MSSCNGWIDWPDGKRYPCGRDDDHDGIERMHAAMVAGEYTNWIDDFNEGGVRTGRERTEQPMNPKGDDDGR